MPIQKFKSPDDARRAQRSVPGSDTNIRRMRFVLDFWSRVHPREIHRGVTKYRSPREAQDAAVSPR